MSDHSGGKLLFLRLWEEDNEGPSKDSGSPDGQTDRPSPGKDSRRSVLECLQHTVSRFSLLAVEYAWVCLGFAHSWTLRDLVELWIRFCLWCICYVWVTSPVSSCHRVPGKETTGIHRRAHWDGREIHRRPTAGPGGMQLQTITCFTFIVNEPISLDLKCV